MLQTPPPLTFIRSFECAARHLSFTKAAEELGYTQAAISNHIRALENYLGRRLFVRYARSLQLTEIGAAFLPTLRQSLDQIDAATEAVLAGVRNRSVVLACPYSFGEKWLPPVLASFHRQHPEIVVTIHGTVWEGPPDGIADISITVNRSDDLPPGSRPLWPETLSIVCAPAVADRLSAPARLADETKIVISGRHDYWTTVAKATGVDGVAQIDMAGGAMFKTNATSIALELAAQGLGVTVAPTSVCKPYLDEGRLVEPFAFRAPSAWTYNIRLAGTPRGSAAEKLMSHLLDQGDASRVISLHQEGATRPAAGESGKSPALFDWGKRVEDLPPLPACWDGS